MKLIGCLGTAFVAFLLFFAYHMATTPPADLSTLYPERDSAYVASVLDALAPIAQEYADIDRFTLDLSVLDVYYNTDLEPWVYQQQTDLIAESFSLFKESKLGVSNVTVRAIYQGRVMATSSASAGKVRSKN